jgi:hypothetical protein
MTGRFVVVPSRSRILWRSVGYGAAAGATVGALVATAIGAAASLATQNPAGIAIGLLVGAPVAAVIGAVLGTACGLTGGLSLVTIRSHVAASRSAIRAVAASGAGMLPAAWSIAVAAGSGQRFLPVLAVLTGVVVMLAAAIGPVAFYGKSPRRVRLPRHPGSVRRDS